MKSMPLVLVLLATATAAMADPKPPGTIDGDLFWVEPRPETLRPRGAEPIILYLNMEGGTYVAGYDDSTANTSSIVATSANVRPYAEAQPERKAELLRCVQLLFGRFALVVTTEDPGDAPHMEAVVTSGLASEIGYPSNDAAGVSPFTCGVIDNSIVWTFAGVFQDDVQYTCETVGQELAHSFGLEHEALCEDPMTYMYDCSPLSFQDVYARCGEYEDLPPEQGGPRDCDCTGLPTQNSVQMLFERIGHGEVLPPEVVITSPADGATVAAPIDVAVTASDNYVLEHVEILLDDTVIAQAIAPPYAAIVARGTAPGVHRLEARAFDAAGNGASASVSFTVAGECVTDSDCPDGRACQDATLCVSGQGGACESHSDCAGNLVCGLAPDGTNLCTATCDPANADCPAGFSCRDEGGAGTCLPTVESSGGCQAAPGRSQGGLATWGALLLLVCIAVFRGFGSTRTPPCPARGATVTSVDKCSSAAKR